MLAKLEEQTEQEISQLVAKNQAEVALLDETYGEHLQEVAQQIVRKITEV